MQIKVLAVELMLKDRYTQMCQPHFLGVGIQNAFNLKNNNYPSSCLNFLDHFSFLLLIFRLLFCLNLMKAKRHLTTHTSLFLRKANFVGRWKKKVCFVYLLSSCVRLALRQKHLHSKSVIAILI